MKIEGVIDSITSKTVSNGGTVFTATIDGEDINLGFSNPYSEGEYVNLVVENTKWGLQLPRKGSGSGVSSVPRPATGGATTGSGPRTNQAFPVDANTKDHSIIRQNSLTNANAAVSTAMGLGMLSTMKSKEELYNEIITVAYNFATFSMGTMDAAQAADKVKGE